MYLFKQFFSLYTYVPSVELAEDLNLVDALVFAKAASSKRESREFINNNSISINGEKVNDPFTAYEKSDFAEDFVLKRGKKNFRKVVVE